MYETESPMVMRGSEKQIARHGTPASMPFKVKDPYTPQDWSDAVRDYHVTFNFLDYHIYAANTFEEAEEDFGTVMESVSAVSSVR